MGATGAAPAYLFEVLAQAHAPHAVRHGLLLPPRVSRVENCKPQVPSARSLTAVPGEAASEIAVHVRCTWQHVRPVTCMALFRQRSPVLVTEAHLPAAAWRDLGGMVGERFIHVKWATLR